MLLKKLFPAEVAEHLRKGIMPIEDLKNFSRDFLSAVLERAGKHKDSLIDSVAGEISKFLSKMNVADEVRKILEGLTVTLEATVNYQKKPKKKKSVSKKFTTHL